MSQAVTRHCLLCSSCWSPTWLTLLPQRWRRHILQKRLLSFTGLSLLFFFFGSTPLCWALAAFISFLILYTVGRTPWTVNQPVSRPLPTYRTTQTQNKRTQYRHLCLEWDSNPRSQRSSERRQFMT
jgi:hypothetical protein